MSKYFVHTGPKSEFRCKCGCGLGTENGDVNQELLIVLDDLRGHFNSPITIVSGLRCPVHNKKVGGAPGSKHMAGIAADVKVKDVTPALVHSYLVAKYTDKYGIGSYRTFTHVDVRPNKTRWVG